ncbi:MULTISPECIES: helix-turn-helix domain-containing protein [unclassified Paenibacillus]|uniref:helix-turn-helix domain-containing protein n=1 Tax=unclassified Paenibacillus TaxID=185978 RepID=UPI00020D71A8|nr:MULTISPECIES: helix-turn-helix domain-containing protein [unclassified Paenibacillus]EGL20091.1 hypothetical protein HMPREF9413_1104 [Paenibacillus sp. HGF7]EPD81993.1 hypothetical protein HMPREF1207_03819 [Paenibacillus sp. HGH0039]
MFSYKPLKRLLVEKEMSKTEFMNYMGFSSSTTAKIWKNENVALSILDDICNKLECKISDVIEHIPSDDYIDEDGRYVLKIKDNVQK